MQKIYLYQIIIEIRCWRAVAVIRSSSLLEIMINCNLGLVIWNYLLSLFYAWAAASDVTVAARLSLILNLTFLPFVSFLASWSPRTVLHFCSQSIFRRYNVSRAYLLRVLRFICTCTLWSRIRAVFMYACLSLLRSRPLVQIAKNTSGSGLPRDYEVVRRQKSFYIMGSRGLILNCLCMNLTSSSVIKNGRSG